MPLTGCAETLTSLRGYRNRRLQFEQRIVRKPARMVRRNSLGISPTELAHALGANALAPASVAHSTFRPRYALIDPTAQNNQVGGSAG